MDCPTIMVHAGKCYKALTDSGAATSLIRYSTYQTIDSRFKTPTQATMTRLNAADGSPMTALGITALQLRIAGFKYSPITSSYVTDYQTWKYYLELISRKFFSLSYAWDKEKNCYIQKDNRFSTKLETVNRWQLLGLSSQLSKYHPDTIQSRSKAKQSKDIWHTSSAIKI